MKSFHFILSTYVMCFLPSCNANSEHSSANVTTLSDSTFSFCYTRVAGKDSVLLHASISGDSISGRLDYKPSEIDQSYGSILGKMHGDTMRLMYNYVTEGMDLTREVIFLKNDTSLIEGLGKMTQIDGKDVFEDVRNVKFNGLVLRAVPCK